MPSPSSDTVMPVQTSAKSRILSGRRTPILFIGELSTAPRLSRESYTVRARFIISKSSFQNVLRCRGALGVARQGCRERSYAVHMGATEDAASRRSARPGDTRFILKGALSARDQDVFEELAGPAAGAAVSLPGAAA